MKEKIKHSVLAILIGVFILTLASPISISFSSEDLTKTELEIDSEKEEHKLGTTFYMTDLSNEEFSFTSYFLKSSAKKYFLDLKNELFVLPPDKPPCNG